MQVIKETNENGADDRVSNSSPDDDVSPAEDLVQNDSFTLTIEDATSKGFLELAAANWSIEQKKAENRRIVATYKAFKRAPDLKDFAHTLGHLYSKANKWTELVLQTYENFSI